MLITTRRRIRLYSAPVYSIGQYPAASYALPDGVSSVGLTGKYTGTIFKNGPMSQLAALNNYYVDPSWFTGPTYTATSEAEFNALNLTGIPEWSTIVVTAGVTLRNITLPKRTSWDPTAGGGLCRIISSGMASLPTQSNGVSNVANRATTAHTAMMFNIIADAASLNAVKFSAGYSGGWVIQGANVFASFGTNTTQSTAALIDINASASDTDINAHPSYIIFSLCCIQHLGTTPLEVLRGVRYAGKYCAFIDSTLTNFFYDSADSQAIWIDSKARGWLGVFNCYLKALSQKIMIGGNDPPPVYRSGTRPKHVDVRNSYLDADSNGLWTTTKYASDSKAEIELKTGENVLLAFLRSRVRMYSGSYKYAYLFKSTDQQQTGANQIWTAAKVYNVHMWCCVIDDCNAGAVFMADIYPNSQLAESMENLEVFGNLFKPGTLQGQPGAPTTAAGYRSLLTYYYSSGPGSRNIRFHHNTGSAKHRMLEGPSSIPVNPTLFNFEVGHNINMHDSLAYGPFSGHLATNQSIAQLMQTFNQQFLGGRNIQCDTTGGTTFTGDHSTRNNINVARASLFVDYAGGNYRVKAPYDIHTDDGLAPGAPIDLIESETSNLI